VVFRLSVDDLEQHLLTSVPLFPVKTPAAGDSSTNPRKPTQARKHTKPEPDKECQKLQVTSENG